MEPHSGSVGALSLILVTVNVQRSSIVLILKQLLLSFPIILKNVLLIIMWQGRTSYKKNTYINVEIITVTIYLVALTSSMLNLLTPSSVN